MARASKDEFDLEGVTYLGLRCGVAGVTHGNRQFLIGLCRPGQALRIEHEPGNPKDRNAVAVLFPDGRHLGYVPGDLSARVARPLKKGGAALAVVTACVGGTSASPNRGLRIALVASGDQVAESELRAALEHLGETIDDEVMPASEWPQRLASFAFTPVRVATWPIRIFQRHGLLGGFLRLLGAVFLALMALETLGRLIGPTSK